ncbi:MAG: tetratricopeptide repeat protein [Hyphomonadaceae bacterium]
MTNDTDSFVQEVDESLRQDQALALVKRFGPYLLGLFVIFLVGIGGWQVWKATSLDAARRQSDAFEAAIEQARGGNLDEAKTSFERLSGEGPQVYRVMADVQRAAILQHQGDLEGALAAFDQAAEKADDPVIRDTIRLRAAYIAADTQDFAALQTRLQPLVESDSRISFLARELLAVEAWEAGQNDLARDTLENLSLAFDAPEAVRQRAQLTLSVLGPAPATPADGATAPAPSEGETK